MSATRPAGREPACPPDHAPPAQRQAPPTGPASAALAPPPCLPRLGRAGRAAPGFAFAADVIGVRAAPRAAYFPGREQQNGARTSGGLRTLAPLETGSAVPGPPRPLPDMEDVEARFAHLLQPIRDLTKNWEVDVAAQLGEYLEEVRVAWGTGAGLAGGAPGLGCWASGRLRGLYIRRSGRARPEAPSTVTTSAHHPLFA